MYHVCNFRLLDAAIILFMDLFDGQRPQDSSHRRPKSHLWTYVMDHVRNFRFVDGHNHITGTHSELMSCACCMLYALHVCRLLYAECMLQLYAVCCKSYAIRCMLHLYAMNHVRYISSHRRQNCMTDLAMDHVRNFRLIDGHNHVYGLSDGLCPQ